MSAPASGVGAGLRGTPSAPAEIPADVALAVAASDHTVSAAQVQVLRNTFGKGWSIEQVQLYLTICARRGIDPFTEAYGFPNSEGGLAFGLRIDGMRAQALRTGELVSRKVTTNWSDPKPDGQRTLIGATAEVQRKGMASPVVESAWMEEYDRGGLGWKQFPETMIRKVAEAKALRAAFADALGGIYEPSEMSKDGRRDPGD